MREVVTVDKKQSFNKKDVRIRFTMREDFKEMIEKSKEKVKIPSQKIKAVHRKFHQ